MRRCLNVSKLMGSAIFLCTLTPRVLAADGGIKARMQAFVDQHAVAGAVTLIARHGEIKDLEAVGYQDLESRTPMRTDTIFQIMSMTKPVTAVGVMILVEEGRVGLLDPVEKYLPEFRGQMLEVHEGDKIIRKAPDRPITIRDLMTHTSGMPSNASGPLKDLYFKMDHTLAEAVTNYAQQPLEFEPGSKWQYSNTGIATLGRIIEVVSYKDYQQFITERILTPLGMHDTFFVPPDDKKNRIAMVYRRDHDGLVRSGPLTLAGDPVGYRKGAKYVAPELGLYSTATDLYAFYQMMLNRGEFRGHRILSHASVELMTSVQTGDLTTAFTAGSGYGLGWEVIRAPAGTLSLLSIGSFRHFGAFGTAGWVDPNRDLIGVLLIQRFPCDIPDPENEVFTAMAEASLN